MFFCGMGALWWPLGRWGVAILLASYIGASGLKKKSLNKSGAVAVRREISHCLGVKQYE